MKQIIVVDDTPLMDEDKFVTKQMNDDLRFYPEQLIGTEDQALVIVSIGEGYIGDSKIKSEVGWGYIESIGWGWIKFN